MLPNIVTVARLAKAQVVQVSCRLPEGVGVLTLQCHGIGECNNPLSICRVWWVGKDFLPTLYNVRKTEPNNRGAVLIMDSDGVFDLDIEVFSSNLRLAYRAKVVPFR